ncbi:MAG: V-type ATP synthase subunit C [Halobacteriota archaeon]
MESTSVREVSKYSYATARVHAMNAKLYPKDTFKKLLVMDLLEIIRFIEESEYKDEVDELARSYSGIDLLEFALHRNMAHTFRKLMDITIGEPHYLIVEYLRRWDIWNIKTIIRGKSYGASDEEIARVLVPAGELSIDFLMSLIRKTDAQEVISSLEGTIYYKPIADIEYHESLMKLEDELDKFYYRRMIEVVSAVTGNSLFLKFIKMEVDIANIKTLFRLKEAEIFGPEALEHTVPHGLYVTDRQMVKMANASLEDFISMLKTYRYWNAIADAFSETAVSTRDVEQLLDKYLADHAWRIARYHPLSILPILGYMVSKSVEVENLTAIARGKEANLPEEIIDDHLVV